MSLERPTENRALALVPVITLVSVAALVLAGYAALRPHLGTASPATESALERTKRTKVLRVGYSGFRPYTIIDLHADANQGVTGFCADMINEIASRQTPPWTVEWHKVTFETLKADIESG